MSQDNLLDEIAHIRKLMERSSKFVSISGLSGVLIGIYALLGAVFGYVKIYGFNSEVGFRDHYVNEPDIVLQLIIAGALVLLLSLLTAVYMGFRKARRSKQSVWNTTSRSMLTAVGLPLLLGGILAFIFIHKGYYDLIAGTLLVFYGVALRAGSRFTFHEVSWLGLLEVLLGLFALLIPGYGLYFWATGFGVLHIIYGLIVYKKYDVRES